MTVAVGMIAAASLGLLTGCPLLPTAPTATAAIAGRTAAASAPFDARRSGLLDMSPALQALQRDDAQNPGMLAVQEGAAIWRQVPFGGAVGAKACIGCHGPAEQAMRGVAARYPAWDTSSGRAIDLGGRLDACRQRQQGLPAQQPDEPAALALAAYVGLHSRGMPIAPPADARLQPLCAEGERLWNRRMGQLDLACTHCHDQRAGARLGGAVMPQGHAVADPVYRLQWQSMGSLRRRLRGCVTGVRAQPWAPDATEWLALEAFLMQRSAGMPVETPALRP